MAELMGNPNWSFYCVFIRLRFRSRLLQIFSVLFLTSFALLLLHLSAYLGLFFSVENICLSKKLLIVFKGFEYYNTSQLEEVIKSFTYLKVAILHFEIMQLEV